MTASSVPRDPPLETIDGVYEIPPPFTPALAADTSDEDEIRARLKSVSRDELVERVVSAEVRLKKYQSAVSNLVTTLTLSPEMTEAFYARSLRALLSDALLTLESVDELRHVECSMPCVGAESPEVKMLEWGGLGYSEWGLEWAPHSWWVSVSAVGSRWGLGFNSLTRVSGIYLKGVIRCAFAKDLTALRISFTAQPQLEMEIESSVGWGAVPIPVREQIEGLVGMEIERFVEERLTGDESMVIVLRRKATAALSESDIEEATDQAKRASSINLRSTLLL